MSGIILYKLALIGALGILCQWLAWRLKLPAILFLLLAGIFFGPVTGVLHPDQLFGDLLFPMISLAVAVILFEGSLTLRLDEIRGLEKVVQRMVTTGLLITWTVTSLATYFFLNFSGELAILFGAMTVVTGPTVIVPMLRTVRPTAHIANILRWEGIVIDPIGALLAVLVFEYIVASHAGSAATWHTLLSFSWQILVGTGLGIAAGQFMGTVLRKHWLPSYLHNLGSLSYVCAVFALANAFAAESGLLTVTVMGMWLANMKHVEIAEIIDFKESLSLLFISALFIILAARLDFGQIQLLGWSAVGVLLVMQFIARPLKISVSSWGSKLSWRERLLLSWIAPRGIVAAAVAAIFSFQLEKAGLPQASLLVPLTFVIIIGTVLLQGTTARAIALGLKVAEPEPRGYLILGANPLARNIAAVLHKHGLRVVVADTNWEHIRNAAMQNLPTFYGNVMSEQADRRLDLVGIGHLLTLSPQVDQNDLAAVGYRTEFGREHIYQLRTERDATGKLLPVKNKPNIGEYAFGDDISYESLSEVLAQGGEIHSTPLSKEFNFDAFYQKHYKRAVLLFTIDPRGNLHVYTSHNEPNPQPGWIIISLMQPVKEPVEPVIKKPTPQEPPPTGDSSNTK